MGQYHSYFGHFEKQFLQYQLLGSSLLPCPDDPFPPLLPIFLLPVSFVTHFSVLVLFLQTQYR